MRTSDKRAFRAQVLAAHGGACTWCSRSLELDDFTIDHLIPAGQYGTLHFLNLIPACDRCNHRRGNVPAADWLWLCERRGVRVRRAELVQSLERLAYRGPQILSWRARKELAVMRRPMRTWPLHSPTTDATVEPTRLRRGSKCAAR